MTPNQHGKLFFEFPTKQIHNQIWQTFRSLKQSYTHLHTEWISYGRHYNHRHWNRAIFSPSNYDSQFNQGAVNRITLNVIKNIIDTIHSKITKHQPDVAVLAEKDDPKAEAQADYVEKFIRERFKTLRADRLQMECYLDACIYGTGILQVDWNPDAEVLTSDGMKKKGDIEIRKILPYEIFTHHEMLGGYEIGNWIMKLRFIHVRELEQKYPQFKFNPEAYRQEFPNRINTLGMGVEYVPILEFWHKKTDWMPKGRHVLAAYNHTLLDEDYDSKYLPFLFLHYSRAPFTFWGVGLGRLLRSIQIEINKCLFHISQNQNLLGRPKLAVERGSNVFPESMSNGVGIWEYTGKPPSPIVFDPTPPEVFKQLEFLIEQAYQVVGISQATATGEPPPAVRSGIAMEHMAERENDRFALSLINYENFKIDVAKRILYEAKRNYKEDDERWFKAVTDSKRYEVVEFKDLNLEDQEYHLNVVTTSSLGHTKAGQLEFLMNLVQMGLIKDPAQIMDLMRIPNEDKIFDTVTIDIQQAREENLRMSKGEIIEPSEFEDQLAHIKTHIIDVKSTKFSNEPQSVKDNKVAHLHKHFALQSQAQMQATLQQQAAQQPQQPPAGAPTSGITGGNQQNQ